MLAGYDDEVAYLSDTGFEELQTTSSSTSPRRGTGPSRLPARRADGHRRPTPTRSHDPQLRPPRAIARNARQMLEPRWASIEGLPALRRFAAEVGGWPESSGLAMVGAVLLPGDRAPRDRRRQLPAHVLALPRGGGRDEAAIAGAAAAEWTQLAASLLAASEAETAGARAVAADRRAGRSHPRDRGAPVAGARYVAAGGRVGSSADVAARRRAYGRLVG